MGSGKHWRLVTYDIRDPKRWAKVYKLMKGRGDHVQYSVFRIFMSNRQLEELRWRLSEVMDEDDDLLIVRLCPSCAKRVIDSREDQKWDEPPPGFEIL